MTPPLPALRPAAPRAALRLAALGLAGLLGGCGPAGPPRGVVLVVVDTLRADHLGCYGYPRATSPRIDAFAADATLFRNAVSPSPWTLPALATLMTSLPPAVHGAQLASDVSNLKWLFDPDGFQVAGSLGPSRTTLAELLAADGFATAAFVKGAYPSRPFGFAQGFDLFSDNDTPGIRFQVEEALRWLDERRPERFLVYLHTIEVHSPYTPIEANPFLATRWPEEKRDAYTAAVAAERERFEHLDFDPGYRGPVDGSLESLAELARGRQRIAPRDLAHLVALYDRGIAYTDHWFGALLDGLDARGLDRETIVVLTSDHGEEFLEHGGLEHNYTYFEEMLRVPLILRAPGEGRGRSVDEQVGLADVLPTLLDLLGVETDAPLQGRSLRPFLRGGRVPERPHVGEASMTPGLRALRTNRWKYIRRGDGIGRLYDLGSDPRERKNRCPAAPQACRRLRETLAALEAEASAFAAALALPPPEAAPLDAETRARLRELGYADP